MRIRIGTFPSARGISVRAAKNSALTDRPFWDCTNPVRCWTMEDRGRPWLKFLIIHPVSCLLHLLFDGLLSIYQAYWFRLELLIIHPVSRCLQLPFYGLCRSCAYVHRHPNECAFYAPHSVIPFALHVSLIFVFLNWQKEW